MWIARMCQYALYFFVPIKSNRIMLYAHLRKGYVCNPKAIMEYLLIQEPEKYELIWVSSFPDSCEPKDGIKVVGRRSFSYFLSFIRTKFFITNDMIDENLIKKRGQVFITTWHGGGAYKKVGFDTSNESLELAQNFKKWYQRIDYFISSCAKCTSLYSKAFGISKDKFLEIGTPRNDIFFENHSEIKQKVHDFYRLDTNTKILLFAPSFQKNTKEKEEHFPNDLIQIAKLLSKTTHDKWVVLFRTHYFIEEKSFPDNELIFDGNLYYDMQELLYAADMLVTDFSSSIWDFALTGRPVFLLEDKLAEYEKKDRGFFTSYKAWPYIKIQNLDEIIKFTKDTSLSDLSTAYKKHYLDMGSFEKGTACKEIANLLKS